MSNSTILHNVSPDELYQKLRELISEELEARLKPEPPKDLLTKKEVAAKLRLSLPTVQRLMADGTIKPYRIGRRILFRADQVEGSLKEIESFKYKRN